MCLCEKRTLYTKYIYENGLSWITRERERVVKMNYHQFNLQLIRLKKHVID